MNNTPKYLLHILIYIFLTITISSQTYKVKKIIDGDTILLEGNRKVRLIGIDTPEKNISDKLLKQSKFYKLKPKNIQTLGKIASKFTKQIIAGNLIELEFDESNQLTNHKDKYNRTLAYVYVNLQKDQNLLKNKHQLKIKQKIMLNKLLIQVGYAKVFRKYKFKYYQEFIKEERDAKKNNKGFWKKEFSKYFL